MRDSISPASISGMEKDALDRLELNQSICQSDILPLKCAASAFMLAIASPAQEYSVCALRHQSRALSFAESDNSANS